MSNSCFIHSSTDGHLGCFHVLVIVNNTALNIEVLMFFQIRVLVSFRYIPRSGKLGQKADAFLIFWGISISLPQWLYQSAFPVQKGSPFSTSCPSLVVCWFIDDSYSDRCEMIPHCDFNLFSWWLGMLSIFSYVYWPSVCPLRRSVYLDPLPFC